MLSLIEPLVNFLERAFQVEEGKLNLEVAILAFSALLAAAGWVLRVIFDIVMRLLQSSREKRDEIRQIQEMIVDVIVYAAFDKESVTKIIAQDKLEALKEMCGASSDFRAFVQPESPDPSFDDYRMWRRKLPFKLMVAIDKFYSNSFAFHNYYHAFATDDFERMSSKRKSDAVDALRAQGKDVLGDYDRLSAALQQDYGSKFDRLKIKTVFEDANRAFKDANQEKSMHSD